METVSGSAMVRQWVDALADLSRDIPDSERIDLIRGLEELKGAAAAAQARTTSDFDLSQREEQAALGEPASRQGRGVAEQVALARRDPPHRGGRHLGLAKALDREMPHTQSALAAGLISEWRATLLVQETAYLAREHREAIDRKLAGPGSWDALETMSDKMIVAEARRFAYRLDPHAVADRARRAESQRTVTLRPAPDTMSYLTGLLPVAQGVACLAVLKRAADAARAAGDERSRGQVMADTLVAALGAAGAARSAHDRPTTWADADSESPSAGRKGVADDGERDANSSRPRAVRSVSVQLVMTDRTLLAGDDEPAHLVGYGTVPAGWARDLVREGDTDVWLRRLYTHPGSGDLLAADSVSRVFSGGLREVLVARDLRCRTPWCDAPIRHADHVRDRASGGPTSRDNGQGLCERCNYAKQALGWRARATGLPGERHIVELSTPTGHHYRSRAPALPGTPSRADPSVAGTPSRLELHFEDVVLAC